MDAIIAFRKASLLNENSLVDREVSSFISTKSLGSYSHSVSSEKYVLTQPFAHLVMEEMVDFEKNWPYL